MNKSVIENIKRKPPSTNEDRGNTSLSMQYKRSANHGSMTTGLSSPTNIDKLIRENLKKNKEKEIAKEIEEFHIKEDQQFKRDAMTKLNENVRKANKVHLVKKKPTGNQKNLSIKLSASLLKQQKAEKSDKPKISLSTK